MKAAERHPSSGVCSAAGATLHNVGHRPPPPSGSVRHLPARPELRVTPSASTRSICSATPDTPRTPRWNPRWTPLRAPQERRLTASYKGPQDGPKLSHDSARALFDTQPRRPRPINVSGRSRKLHGRRLLEARSAGPKAQPLQKPHPPYISGTLRSAVIPARSGAIVASRKRRKCDLKNSSAGGVQRSRHSRWNGHQLTRVGSVGKERQLSAAERAPLLPPVSSRARRVS